MPPLTNARQELFVQNWILGKPITQCAITAGYKPDWAASIASRLSRKVNVLTRYNELQSATSDKTVLTKQQRMEILSEIASDKLTKFTDDAGVIDRKKLDSHAIQSIDQVMDTKRGAILKLRLHNPVTAIDLLNKMDGSNAPEKVDITSGGESFYELLDRLRGYGNSDKEAEPGGLLT